ncbi:MAG: hypothetical protein GY798_20000 [Hyphomicrobiales bacterium]|nr:hypothetical protein [Hyphomicrobiales bacterium]
MSAAPVKSICVFGSAARKTTDALSDMDVLILAEDRGQRFQLKRLWEERGWSVSEFSPSRFLRLVGAGSLFVQHLKMEGLLLSDAGGWMRNVLDGAALKTSYLSDALKSVCLAKPLERLNPFDDVSNQPLAADLAYVAVRNFSICASADKGCLSFDYHDLVTGIRDAHGLNRRETTLLHSLREAKKAYRDGAVKCHVSGTIGDLSHVLSKIFTNCPLTQVDAVLPLRGSGYVLLRDFEAAATAHLGRPVLGDATHEFRTFWNKVRSPREYSWQIRSLDGRQLYRCLMRCSVDAPEQPYRVPSPALGTQGECWSFLP